MKKPNKPILAIETSGELCSAVVYFSENEHSEISIQGKYIHSEKLAMMIQQLFSDNAIEAKDLEYVAISEGPGSFTGLRIGFAVAKGIAYAANIPVLPVPSFKAMALQISNYLPEDSRFCIAVKVNRDEIYFQKYITKTEKIELTSEIQIIKAAELLNFIDNEEIIFGSGSPEIKKGISLPNALFVAKWSYFFGKDLLTYDYDFIEPNYLKKFIVREKK